MAANLIYVTCAMWGICGFLILCDLNIKRVLFYRLSHLSKVANFF